MSVTFPVEAGHPNSRGHALIKALWAAYWERADDLDLDIGDSRKELSRWLLALPADDQIALLKASVERMPYLRTGGYNPDTYRQGVLLYSSAIILYYDAKLPLSEDDLCEILLTSRHRCGHCGDAIAPFDLSRDYMRQRGYSQRLGAAVKAFARDLPGGTISTNHLKRNAALLEVLDTDLSDLRRKRKPTWIDKVRAAMADIVGDERREWERYVLSMTVMERHEMPRKWEPSARELIGHLGADGVLRRFSEWWPVPAAGERVSMGSSGPQLLKHFVWTLGLLPVPDGESLVCRLAEVGEWQPSSPMAVLKPAITYLSRSSSPEASRARAALQRQT